MKPTTPEHAWLDLLVDCVTQTVADVPDTASIYDWCATALTAARRANAAVTMAVRIVDEAESRELNRMYRDRDAPTNVLSFPAGLAAGPPGEPRPLGDIVVCAPLVVAEATEQGKRPADHWCHLVVHGTLHLVGFDHVRGDDADRMEALERQILEKYGIPDPYQFTPTITNDCYTR